jgi:hypothetical protein
VVSATDPHGRNLGFLDPLFPLNEKKKINFQLLTELRRNTGIIKKLITLMITNMDPN